MKKIGSILVVLLFYIIAAVGVYFLYHALPTDGSALKCALNYLICDGVATAFIFLVGLIFKNPSFYDPYWSLAPIMMSICYYITFANHNTFALIYVLLICVWGIRLTINWAIHFNGLKHVDWRYTMLKEKHPKLFPLINFGGIHLMPTAIVFVAMMPALDFIQISSTSSFVPSIATIVAYLIILAAIVIETIADIEMLEFKNDPNNKGKILDKGLWKNSRHPNYFGEVLFWIGIFLMDASFEASKGYLIVCPLIMFLLFELVSVKMMDKRQLASKPGFKEYMERTNALLIVFPPKKNK